MNDVASRPLMTTKLHVPQQRPDAVFRTRLAAQLEVGIGSRLTLIAAPAGFGKTSALAGWIASSNDSRKVAWLSLDEGDNAPEIFWRYLLASMNEAVSGIASAALSILDEPAAVIESVLTTLINDCHEHGADIVVVLDDLHVINRPEIRWGLRSLWTISLRTFISSSPVAQIPPYRWHDCVRAESWLNCGSLTSDSPLMRPRAI